MNRIGCGGSNGEGMSRQKQLESAAQFVGNAAAHLVLYQDPAGIREAIEYLGQAEIRIQALSWNEAELERFRDKALRRATQEIRERTGESRGVRYEQAIAQAAEVIERFIEQRSE